MINAIYDGVVELDYWTIKF